ncbi:MAG: sensor N-terminal transmembrane domain-containing protein, partial [Sphingomonadales bacterium]
MPKADVDRFNLGWSRGLTLTARILAVNLFALVLMATGLFFLDSYRTRLVAERQLAAEAQVRLLAASLPLVDGGDAEALIAQSARTGKMRIRI